MLDIDRNGLGDFLRSRRQRLKPEEVGLSGARRRRTPGLRREEVAELAGIGVDWYVRLEQGRRVTPSALTVDSLARALKLDKAEHAHLRALAQKPGRRAFSPEVVPDVLRRIVEGMTQPALVKGLRWDVLAWNDAAARTFTDFSRLEGDDRNIVAFMFTNPDAKRLFGSGWAEEAKYALAQFRRSHDLWAGDPAFISLIEAVRRKSPEFTRWWEAYDVRSAATGRKTLQAADGSTGCYDYATFITNDDPPLRMAIYTPVEER